jgi:tetratricopeptide (TPR) repeat protein
MNAMTENLSSNKASMVIEKVMHIFSIGFIFLFPLMFLPTTTNFYQPNKLALSVIMAAVSLLLWAIKMLVEKKTILRLTPLTLPLVALAIVTIASSLAATGDSTEQFLGRGGLIPALVVWIIALTNIVTHKKFATQALYALFASTTLLSIIAVFQALGLGFSNIFNAAFGTTIPNDLSFTPAGTPLGFLSLSLPVGIATLLLAVTRKEVLEKVVLFLLAAIIASGTILTIIFSLPGKETSPSILPLKYGYSIAIDTLKNTKTLLVGYGPESFLNAFTRTRPASMNQTDLWNVRFTSSSSEVLNILTTTGVLGLLAWVALVISLLRLGKSKSNSQLFAVIKVVGLVFVLLQVLLPSSYTLMFGFLVLLALAMLLVTTDSKETGSNLNLTAQSIAYSKGSFTLPLLPILFALLFVSMAGYGLYHTVKAYAAETIFRQSLTAAASNQGVQTYDRQRTAIQNYPTVSRFRRAYAATNLALANSLAGKENINDDEKRQVNQLIQQAIREGKAAVTLDQTNVLNWESLAMVYRSLIGVAQEAPQWTLATYSQAIQVDPSNPQLWLQLGGVYYSLQQYDQAVRVFQRVTELKPDFANGYYNLASAHLQRKETLPAYQAMQRTVSLLEQGSADYVKAQEELTKLEEQVKKEFPQAAAGQQPNAQAPAQGELQTPLPTPTANPQVQVDLNEESGPETLPQQEETQVDEVLEQPAPTPAPQP